MNADVLGRAITCLTSEQQEVLIFTFFDGFGTDEIARIMDKREGAVRALQMRAAESAPRPTGPRRNWL
jgi:DNA-directed RNA polymerase specialized sigma24 family protein